ncbi:hypothetical protein ROBYS_34980 [Roseobacter sp. OBYS 0001]|nr:hypothetical protein ROBYS_34980 [Roseobacter sp. OBYS 0001]
MYFDSNDNDIWEYTQEGVVEDLGWGLSKYQKVRRSLVRLGMAETKKLYGKDPETGKKVVKGFKVQVHLRVVIQYLENASKCLKSTSSKSTQLRDTLNKGLYNSNVLDENDRF